MRNYQKSGVRWRTVHRIFSYKHRLLTLCVLHGILEAKQGINKRNDWQITNIPFTILIGGIHSGQWMRKLNKTWYMRRRSGAV